MLFESYIFQYGSIFKAVVLISLVSDLSSGILNHIIINVKLKAKKINVEADAHNKWCPSLGRGSIEVNPLQ